MFICMLLRFFFFKQKTAYEMRISDWSSDVCSSDLVHPEYAKLAPWRHDPARAKALLAEAGYPEGVDVELTIQQNPPHHLRHATALAQIGRASCRERVCQYGVDLGGRRTIKKKKTKTL